RYKNFLEETKLPINEEKEGIVQPATVQTNIFNNFPIKLSDIRVSNRVLRYNITIKPFGPLYNDISGEIDSTMVQHLDRNLYIGGEVKEVYDELIRTISEDHLRFDLDDYVQKAPNTLRYESSYTSSLLVKFGKTKSINNSLVKNENPPWGKRNFREWNKTPLIDRDWDLENDDLIATKTHAKKMPADLKPLDIKPEKIELYKHCDPTEFRNKEFNVWLRWWKTYLSSEDYIKYLTTQTSDYLGLIFHLYDQDENPILSQTDEEIKLINEKEKAEKERFEIIDNLKNKKFNYEAGLWNPDSIFLGGLGKDPLPDKNEDPVFKFKQSLEKSRPKSYKIQFFKGDREEKNDEEEARNKMLEMLKEKKRDAPQQRLERVWTLLRMSDNAKLDMAIKYCTSAYADKLMEAIEDWETATNLIVQREKHIYELESFERFASDPNSDNLPLIGHRGSSAARLEEALKRENLYKQIETLQTKIEAVLKIIDKKYRDVITYNERPYLEKMKWDRIEMLHWLTEERRKKYFKNEIRTRQLKTSLIEI
ncbi:coiled-coil domain-containing 87-like isoform X1, partial [Brachionus plicatilis]